MSMIGDYATIEEKQREQRRSKAIGPPRNPNCSEDNVGLFHCDQKDTWCDTWGVGLRACALEVRKLYVKSSMETKPPTAGKGLFIRR